MATQIKILSKKEKIAFENAPKYFSEERKKYFYIGKWEQKKIDRYKTDIAKIGFLLQLGYFKSTKKFFHPEKFENYDIDYISKKLNIPIPSSEIDLNNYKEITYRRQQKIILERTGFQKYTRPNTSILTTDSKVERTLLSN